MLFSAVTMSQIGRFAGYTGAGAGRRDPFCFLQILDGIGMAAFFRIVRAECHTLETEECLEDDKSKNLTYPLLLNIKLLRLKHNERKP